MKRAVPWPHTAPALDNIIKEDRTTMLTLQEGTQLNNKPFAFKFHHQPEYSERSFIEQVQPRPHFHPLVDLFTGMIMGYEVLSRGLQPYETPHKMFEEAKNLGLTWELEKACRVAALKKVASFTDDLRSATYFINVSPDSFSDPRFTERFTRNRLTEYGLDQRQVVIEVTEEKSFGDYDKFQKLVTHYVNQGFKISLDDFGAGYSGLIALIACTPHYLKLDMAIVRDVHKHDYKQKLVKSVASFAGSVNSKLIAEGVESWEELELLVKYGIRYVQGFLFGRPQETPYGLPEELKEKIAALVKKYDQTKADLDAQIGGMVIRPMTLQRNTLLCRALDDQFKKSPHLDHVVILDGESVDGLITRQHFYLETGGAFGYQLFQKKQVDVICKYQTLIVEDKITVTALAKLAMDRFQEDLYDPVLVVDYLGRFLGSVTMKQVITKAVELEIRCAMAANPLTNLPGNVIIHHWIRDILMNPEYAIIYGDLDHFKGFNDTYGFLMGDELLRLTARILSENMALLHKEAKLGHVGGDDFVIICPGIVSDNALEAMCLAYDHAKLDLFKHDHVKKGYFEIIDRQGNPVQVPLVTMSLAVIDSRKIWIDPHPALFSELAASLKKKVKQLTSRTGRSGYIFEQRSYD